MDITKLEKEIAKHNESFCSEVRGMTETQIKDTLARESLKSQEISQAKADCEELQEAKQTVKEISQPYNEAQKKQKQKIEFLVKILEEKVIK